ncbi:AI-2E family transporter [Clostridium sp. AM58-1XD]|uniref:AI-2E family transporter n=1 Tax=Clostridium sp. AM58-1XD TaxID=2292307 RepID=UPI002683E369
MIDTLTDLFARDPDMVSYLNSLVIDWNAVFNEVVAFLKNGAGSVLNTTFAAAVSIVSGVTTFGIGFVFSIYVLLQKEVLARQFKKFIMAFLPEQIAERFLEVAALTERTFSNFLTGQCLEAVILGSMFFVTMSVLRMPYALLMGVLIAFTALIPIFGAFIGCAIGIFLMLMVSPMNALAFVILFNVIQQIEGNFIYPHVVGGSVGLPSIWVLVAVTLGGSLMGVVGMLVFIPICSVLYSLLKRTVNKRLEIKGKAEA